MKTRMTKTLLDSWGYMYDCPEGFEQKAREEFIATLKREKTPPTAAQQAGLDFEDLVRRIAEGQVYDEEEKGYAGARRIAEIVRGGQWQMHVDTDLTVDGREFWLHGYCDVVKAGMIYDIKFKNRNFSDLDLWGSYRNSAQHSAYLRCLPEAYGFMYLVSDGESLYTERYDRKNSVPIEEIVRYFMKWLEREPELMRIYEERWTAYG